MNKKASTGTLIVLAVGFGLLLALDFVDLGLTGMTGSLVLGDGTDSNCSTYVNESSTLVGNITGCTGDGLIINASNIVLDCQGHKISSLSSSNNGLSGYGLSNVTIKNCLVEGFSINYNFGSINNSILLNNSGSNADSTAFSLTNFQNLTLQNNRVLGASGESTTGFSVSTGENLSFINNSVTGTSQDNLYFVSVNNSLVEDNIVVCTESINGILDFSNKNVSFINNTISMCNQSIMIQDANSSFYQDNVVYNNTKSVSVLGNSSFIMVNTSFLPDSGSFVNYTVLSINDSVLDGEEYYINWSGAPSIPGGYSSFSNKFVSIANSSGSPSIDNIAWSWNESEVSGYTESNFNLFVFNSSGNFSLNDTPDTTNNVLSVSNLVPSSTYGILEAQSTFHVNITFISQVPLDISSSNAIGTPVNITYYINSTDGIDYSTLWLYYKTNTTSSDCWEIINGTNLTCGYQPRSVSSNVSNLNWSWLLRDNQIYPAISNLDEEMIEETVHTTYNLTDKTKDLLKVRFFNVSNSKTYSYLEFMALNRSGTSTALNIWYCNSSYAAGIPSINANCVDFYSLSASTQYNHTHPPGYSTHYFAPFSMNSTTGRIGTVYVTPVSYFIFDSTGNNLNGWNIYYITNVSRQDSVQNSTNRGTSWTNLSGTVDMHLHQYDGSESFWYYACANDTNGNGSCSSVRQDLINLSGLPPTSPYVYNPANGAYSGNIAINYTEALSPNGYPISFYNISLLNSDYSFNKTIQSNNSVNLGYLWDITGTANGDYFISVEVCDNLSQCSYGYSANFTISNGLPFSLSNITFPNSLDFFTNYNETSDIGELVNVTWQDAGAGAWYNLSYSNDSGVTWNYLNYTNKTYFEWQLNKSFVEGTNYTLNLTLSDGSYSDVSDSQFWIGNCNVTGIDYTGAIRWTANDVVVCKNRPVEFNLTSLKDKEIKFYNLSALINVTLQARFFYSYGPEIFIENSTINAAFYSKSISSSNSLIFTFAYMVGQGTYDGLNASTSQYKVFSNGEYMNFSNTSEISNSTRLEVSVSAQNFHFNLTNSSINTLWLTSFTSNVSIINTKVKNVFLSAYPNSPLWIENFKKITSISTRVAHSIDGSNLTVENFNLTNLIIQSEFQNVTTHTINSTVHTLSVKNFNDSNHDFSDSILDQFFIDTPTSLFFNNSAVLSGDSQSEFNAKNITLNISESNFTMPRYVKLNSDTTIYGNFNTSPVFMNWSVPANVTRYFPVHVLNSTGGNHSGANVSVYNSTGSLVWFGVTDVNGLAEPNVTFTNFTYDDSYRIIVRGSYGAGSLSLFSDTPIEITAGDFVPSNITYPNSLDFFTNYNETSTSGEIINVTWTDAGAGFWYYLDYSNNSGTTWYPLNFTNLTYFEWQLNNSLINSINYRLRITVNDGFGNITNDTSDSNFWIGKCNVPLISSLWNIDNNVTVCKNRRILLPETTSSELHFGGGNLALVNVNWTKTNINGTRMRFVGANEAYLINLSFDGFYFNLNTYDSQTTLINSTINVIDRFMFESHYKSSVLKNVAPNTIISDLVYLSNISGFVNITNSTINRNIQFLTDVSANVSNSTLQICNSYFSYENVSINYVDSNCTGQFNVIFGYAGNYSVKNLKSGSVANNVPINSSVGSVLNLSNSEIGGAIALTFNSAGDSQLLDSNVSYLFASKGNISVYNATISGYSVFSGYGTNVFFNESNQNTVHIVQNATLNFTNSTIYRFIRVGFDNILNPYVSRPVIYGNLNITNKMIDLWYVNAVATRYFPIQVFNKTSGIEVGANVSIYNSTGGLVASAITDANGFVDLPVNFTNTTFAPGNFSIIVKGSVGAGDISFAADTPIIIQTGDEVNITSPLGGEFFTNYNESGLGTGEIINITWSDAGADRYYVQASNDSGVSWLLINSTNTSNYFEWNISKDRGINESTNYSVRVVAETGGFNFSNSTSGQFWIGNCNLSSSANFTSGSNAVIVCKNRQVDYPDNKTSFTMGLQAKSYFYNVTVPKDDFLMSAFSENFLVNSSFQRVDFLSTSKTYLIGAYVASAQVFISENISISNIYKGVVMDYANISSASGFLVSVNDSFLALVSIRANQNHFNFSVNITDSNITGCEFSGNVSATINNVSVSESCSFSYVSRGAISNSTFKYVGVVSNFDVSPQNVSVVDVWNGTFSGVIANGTSGLLVEADNVVLSNVNFFGQSNISDNFIVNSSLYYLRLTNGNNFINESNVTIAELTYYSKNMFYNTLISSINRINSALGGISGSSESSFFNSTVSKIDQIGLENGVSNATIRGNLSISTKTIGQWRNGSNNVTRYFPIYVENSSSQPHEGANVSIYNKTGSLVGFAVTDSNGLADIPLVFSNGNGINVTYNNETEVSTTVLDNFSIEVVGSVGYGSLNFLSNTPIIIQTGDEVNLTYPVGGEFFTNYNESGLGTGEIINITWSDAGADRYYVQASNDSGVSWLLINSTNTSNYFEWNISKDRGINESTNYSVRVFAEKGGFNVSNSTSGQFWIGHCNVTQNVTNYNWELFGQIVVCKNRKIMLPLQNSTSGADEIIDVSNSKAAFINVNITQIVSETNYMRLNQKNVVFFNNASYSITRLLYLAHNNSLHLKDTHLPTMWLWASNLNSIESIYVENVTSNSPLNGLLITILKSGGFVNFTNSSLQTTSFHNIYGASINFTIKDSNLSIVGCYLEPNKNCFFTNLNVTGAPGSNGLNFYANSHNVNKSFNNLRNPQLMNGVLASNSDGSSIANLTNVSATYVVILVAGANSTTTVLDSNVTAITNIVSYPSNTIVQNTTITSNIFLYYNSTTYLNFSRNYGGTAFYGNSVLNCSNSSLTYFSDIGNSAASRIFIHGTFNVTSKDIANVNRYNWVPGAVVTRYYPIQVLNKTNQPEIGANVSIYNRTGSLVGFAVTNAEGWVNIPVNFTSQTWANTTFNETTNETTKHFLYNFSIAVQGSVGYGTLNFISDTPIEITAGEEVNLTSVFDGMFFTNYNESGLGTGEIINITWLDAGADKYYVQASNNSGVSWLLINSTNTSNYFEWNISKSLGIHESTNYSIRVIAETGGFNVSNSTSGNFWIGNCNVSPSNASLDEYIWDDSDIIVCKNRAIQFVTDRSSKSLRLRNSTALINVTTSNVGEFNYYGKGIVIKNSNLNLDLHIRTNISASDTYIEEFHYYAGSGVYDGINRSKTQYHLFNDRYMNLSNVSTNQLFNVGEIGYSDILYMNLHIEEETNLTNSWLVWLTMSGNIRNVFINNTYTYIYWFYPPSGDTIWLENARYGTSPADVNNGRIAHSIAGFNLTVSNFTMQRFALLEIFPVTLNSVNSSIGSFSSNFGAYSINNFINNSYVQGGYFGSSSYYFNNSNVFESELSGNALLNISNTSWRMPKTVLLNANATIYGNFNVSNKGASINWSVPANVTRHFPVYVRNLTGSPVSGALVNVSNATHVIWSGYTDANGWAEPNVTFTNATYNLSYNITASWNPTVSGNLWFFDDTPIILQSNCVDADGDGFNVSEAGCGVADCDDSNYSILPPYDGIQVNRSMKFCNGTYYLSPVNNVTINVSASNLTLDCNWASIIGKGGVRYDANYGITMWGKENILIRNCNLSNFSTIISVGSYSNNVSLVDSVLVNSSVGDAVSILDSSNLSLFNLSVSQAYSNGIYAIGCSNVNISSLSVSRSNIGVTVSESVNFSLSNLEVFNNSNAGFKILSELILLNMSISDSHVFGNGVSDFLVRPLGGSGLGYVFISNLSIDNPSGDFVNYTIINLNDSFTYSEWYSIKWSGTPVSLPVAKTSFAGKFLNITNLSAGVSIDSISFTWTESETAGYNESRLQLWRYNGSWSVLNNTPDTLNNVLTLSNLNPASTYGILEDINLPPLIVLNSPANNSQINNTNTINLSFNVTDDVSTALSCDLYVNGAYNQTNSSVANGTMTTFSIPVNYSVYSWSVNCSDGELSDVSDVWFFYVNDTFAPVVLNVTPLVGSNFTNGTVVNITANVTDPYHDSIDTVLANVSWDSTSMLLVMSRNGDIFNATFTNTQYIGIYNVTIIANDTSGNVNDTEKTWFNITSDYINNAPNVTLLAPPNQTVLNNAINVTLNYTVIDDHNLTLDCFVYVDASVYSFMYNQLNNTVISITYPLGPSKVGNHLWYVNCTDGALSNVSETWEFYLNDTLAPVISAINVTTTNDTVTVNWTTDEPSNVTITYGLNLSLGSNISNASFVINHSIIIPGLLPNTTYYYNLTICDAYGNCNTTGPFNFTTEPNLLGDLPPSITSLGCTPSPTGIGNHVTCRANVVDDIGIGDVSANVTKPNSIISVQNVSCSGSSTSKTCNFTFAGTDLTGTYSVLWFANDTDGSSDTAPSSFLIRTAATPSRSPSRVSSNGGTSVDLPITIGSFDKKAGNLTMPIEDVISKPVTPAVPQQVSPVVEEPAGKVDFTFPYWIIIVLIAVIILPILIFLVKRREEKPKLVGFEKPVAEYIIKSREASVNDLEIRSNLINAEWDEKLVDTVFEKLK